MKLNYLLLLLVTAHVGYASRDKDPKRTFDLVFHRSGSVVHHAFEDKGKSTIVNYTISHNQLEDDGSSRFTGSPHVSVIIYPKPDDYGVVTSYANNTGFYSLIKKNTGMIYNNWIDKKNISSVAVNPNGNLTAISRNKDIITYNSDNNIEKTFTTKNNAIKRNIFSPQGLHHVVVPTYSGDIDWYNLKGKRVANFSDDRGSVEEIIFNNKGDKFCASHLLINHNATIIKIFDPKADYFADEFSLVGLLNSGWRTGPHASTFFGSDDRVLMGTTQDTENNRLYSYFIDTRSGKQLKYTYPKEIVSIFEPVDTYWPITYEPDALVVASVLDWRYLGKTIDFKDKNGYTHAALNPKYPGQIVFANDFEIKSLPVK